MISYYFQRLASILEHRPFKFHRIFNLIRCLVFQYFWKKALPKYTNLDSQILHFLWCKKSFDWCNYRAIRSSQNHGLSFPKGSIYKNNVNCCAQTWNGFHFQHGCLGKQNDKIVTISNGNGLEDYFPNYIADLCQL